MHDATFSPEGEHLCVADVSLTDLDLAGAGKTASTAAGSEATAARAVLPGPTSPLGLGLKHAHQLALNYDLEGRSLILFMTRDLMLMPHRKSHQTIRKTEH